MERGTPEVRHSLPHNNQDYADDYVFNSRSNSAALIPALMEQKSARESTAYCQSGYQPRYPSSAFGPTQYQQRYQVHWQQMHHSVGYGPVQSDVQQREMSEMVYPGQPMQQATYRHTYQTSNESNHETFSGRATIPEMVANYSIQAANPCRENNRATHSALYGDTMPTGQENSRVNRVESTDRVCGVCGDVAKSYHFGGLSCDSCKAFFRRSVQNSVYVKFQCYHTGNCSVTINNRKSCQYCRMKRCFEIGMEKSWVMSEEERKTLMKERSQKKLSKQLAAASFIPKTTAQDESPSSDPLESDKGSYVPDVKRMKDFMSELEMREIESVVTKYVHAYQQIPYRKELCPVEKARPGSQMMEMLGTLIRRFAFYARTIPDFASLPSQDQRLLLKGGVFEMCLLRGAHVFDPTNNRWPNRKMSLYTDAPVLELDNITILASSRLFQMHIDFIRQVKQLEVDEPATMLLILIVLFTTRPNLSRPDWVEKYQAYYVSLLEHYTEWRYGPVRWRQVFCKLLTKLSDLRELTETHNQRNLNLGSEELQAIQQQLQYLNINPFPELEIMPNDESSRSFEQDAQEQLEIPVQEGSQKSHFVSHQQQKQPLPLPPSPYNSVPEASHRNALPINHSLHSQFPQHGSQHQSFSTITTPTSSFAYQQSDAYQDPALQQNIQQKTEPPKMPAVDSTDVRQHDVSNSIDYATYGNLGATAQSTPSKSISNIQNVSPNMSSATEMGMQFMRAMHQSVSQVVDKPHFGFEWVQPDYRFDGFEDVLKEFTDSQAPPPSQQLQPQTTGSRPSSEMDSKVKKPYDRVEPVEAATHITLDAVEELYYELERYSELYH